MYNSGIFTCGINVSVYEMTTGENIPWHKHSNMHGHVVLRGKTLIEIDNQPPFEMTRGMVNKELPSDIWHKITALEPDTLFLHISVTDPTATTEIKDISCL